MGHAAASSDLWASRSAAASAADERSPKLGRVLLGAARSRSQAAVASVARVRLAASQLRLQLRSRRALGLGFRVERHERAGGPRRAASSSAPRPCARPELAPGPPELRDRGLVLLRERRAPGRGSPLVASTSRARADRRTRSSRRAGSVDP